MTYLPKRVKEVTDYHINTIESSLPKFLESYYICGSASLGAFDTNNSDIDFVAIINRKATEMDIEVLKKIHDVIHKKYKRNILDGMYLLKEDFESLVNGEITCIRFNDGVFQGIRMFHTDSVDAFGLRKYGITLKGHKIENFKYTVDFDILIYKMKDNLNTYWRNWVNDSRRCPSIRYISLFVNLKSIEWGVLGVSRILYTFMEKDITSKVGAGDYALKTVPKRWHMIINEAMRLRKNIKKSYYKSVFQRRRDVIGYINYIIQEINKLSEMK